MNHNAVPKYRDWESLFRSWKNPPSNTEEEKCQAAIRAIRSAIDAHQKLKKLNLKIVLKGSYRDNTNVRLNSDVDLAVVYPYSYFTDYSFASGLTDSDIGLTTDVDYPISDFRADVADSITAKFGASEVEIGNKAIKIRSNSYRVDADVVPSLFHRRYRSDKSWVKPEGISFTPNNGGRITNWPEQNYENGATKNKATGGRYKSVVRIIKRLSIEMEEVGIPEAKGISSYLIQCLVWNVPNSNFGSSTLYDDVQNVFAHLWGQLKEYENCKEWGEVNEMKYLFRGSQPWTREQAYKFIDEAWSYVGVPSS